MILLVNLPLFKCPYISIFFFKFWNIGHDVNIYVDKGHVYPESTKNGFVSLIAETENAEVTVSQTEVSRESNVLFEIIVLKFARKRVFKVVDFNLLFPSSL